VGAAAERRPLAAPLAGAIERYGRWAARCVETRAQVGPAPAGSAARGVRSAEPIVGDGRRDAGGITWRMVMAVARGCAAPGRRTPDALFGARFSGRGWGGTPGGSTPDVLFGTPH
jgi:hypothetical protein